MGQSQCTSTRGADILEYTKCGGVNTPFPQFSPLMLATCRAEAFPAAGATKLGELKMLSPFFHISSTRFGCRWVMCAQFHSTLNLVVGLDDFSQRVDKDESFSPCFITLIFALRCSGVIHTHSV